MSLDPYSPCPCGNGKKLKFCCSDIAADMLKALHLHESGQAKAGLKILEKLYEQDAKRPWVATSLAAVQLHMEAPEEARKTLVPLLEDAPDHPLGRILDATAALDLHDYHSVRSVVHRAFTKGVKVHPEMVGSLASDLSSTFYRDGHFMAARQHLALSMRFVREQDRQEIFLRMLDIDGETSIPYLLRSVHNLKPLELAGEEDQNLYKKAMNLSSLGCWHEAATILLPLIEKYPDNAGVPFNIGLFYAWDGDEFQAAEHLHRAAKVAKDREFAVYAETMAQLLELDRELVREPMSHYSVPSVSRLLTVFDEIKFIVKAPENRQYGSNDPRVTRYLILDQEPGAIPEKIETEADLKNLPRAVGRIICFSGDGDHQSENSSFCRIVIQHGQDSLLKELEQRVGNAMTSVKLPEDEHLQGGGEWKDYYGIYQDYYLPQSAPVSLHAHLQRINRQKIEQHDWLNRPLTALQGLTPLQAKERPDLSTQLAAATYVFDAYANLNNCQIDLAGLQSKLGVEALAPYEISQDAHLNTCDVFQMLRIPVEKLSESQLALLLNRGQLNQHLGFNERLLVCVLQYPEIADAQRMSQIYNAYIGLARSRFDHAEALRRIQQAKAWSQEIGQKIEDAIQWELQELRFRVFEGTPDDAELQEFLNRLYSRYLRKFPELEESVVGFLKEQGITPPWKSASSVLIADASGAVGSSWGQGDSSTPATGKLWLPGQR